MLPAFINEVIKINFYSKSTISLMIAGLKSYHKWLRVNKYINPNDRTIQYLDDFYKNTLTSNLSISTRKETETYFNNDDIPITELIKAANSRNVNKTERERDIAILHFLLSTDTLPNELCKLRVKDFDIPNHIVALRMGKSGTRLQYVLPDVLEAINRYWLSRGWFDKDDPAFARHDRGAGKKHLMLTTRSIQNIIRNISDVAGFGRTVTANILRIHYYQRALDYKIDLANINKVLGFGQFTTKCKYYPPNHMN